MRLISWNVNGLRAARTKGFDEVFATFDADVFGVQEIKLQQGQIELDLPGYHQYWNYAQKKGYSGTAVFSKQEALQVLYGFAPGETDPEGRVLAVELPDLWFVCIYSPNSQDQLKRLDFRMDFEDRMRAFLLDLAASKPVVMCGDLNVAHQEIDLKNPDSNHGTPGFSDEERAKFQQLLDAGFVDSFRHLYPNVREAYSWWSMRTRARERNVGWRIDYFVISPSLVPLMRDASIYPQVMGSDHCPVGLELDL